MSDDSKSPASSAQADWMASNERLDQLVRLLVAALGLHTAAKGPFPEDLMVEVDEMRRENTRLFNVLMVDLLSARTGSSETEH
jgi:hypothetical protein